MNRHKNHSHYGFTIVELLIVIVVIAILATITVLSYRGVQQQAVEASMESDLHNAVSALDVDNLKGGYPDDGSQVNGGQGFKVSQGNTLTYVRKPYGFCLTVSNPRSSTQLRIRGDDDGRTPVEGNCDTTVTTLTGTGGAGYVDGGPSVAQIYGPRSIAVDDNGYLYVTDFNHRVRKITPDGTVSTLAGSGTAGFAEGQGASAQFSSPDGVAVDAAGNVYIADTSNHRIRKITPSGTVSTLAGTGVQGFTDGAGSVARFYNPNGLTLGPDNNLYVADGSNFRVRKVTLSGEVSTVASGISSIQGIAVDRGGAAYVTIVIGNPAIRHVSPSGVVTTLAGGGSPGYAEGTGSAAQFNYPYAIAIDSSGYMYVADYINQRIRKVSPDGTVSTLAGTGTAGYVNGTGNVARFNYPRGIAVDKAGTLYVTENGNRIRKIVQ